MTVVDMPLTHRPPPPAAGNDLATLSDGYVKLEQQPGPLDVAIGAVATLAAWVVHPPFYLLGLIESWGAHRWDLSDMETWTEYEQRVSANGGSTTSSSSTAG